MENLDSMGSNYLGSIWRSFLVIAKLTLKLTDANFKLEDSKYCSFDSFCIEKPTH